MRRNFVAWWLTCGRRAVTSLMSRSSVRRTPGLATGRSSGWNLPVGWVISRRPAHPALVSEADFIAVQEISAPRGPAGPATHQYLLAELIRCGTKPNRNAY